MAAGLSYDLVNKKVITAYDWQEAFPGADIRGASGAQLAFITSIYDHSQTDTVVLFAGFNNLKDLTAPIDSIVAEYKALYFALPAKRVICVGVPLMDHSKSDGWWPAGVPLQNSRIQEFDDKIKLFCPNYVNTPALLGPDDTDDGVHPNRQGYQKIAGGIMKYVH